MSSLLDNVRKLLDLPEDELRELLLDEKYNKANLREMIRRLIKQTKEYKRAFEYEREANKELEEKLEKKW